jgi:hypothetical protein
MPGRTAAAARGFGIAILISIVGCSANSTVSAGSSHTPPAPASAGSQAAPSTPPAPVSSAPSSASSSSSAARAASGLARCHTSQLAGRVRSLGAAAGNRYAALILTNTSDVRCRTYGYVGLQLTSGGADLPTRVIREAKPAPHRVVLEPGESAFTRIHWTVVPGDGEPTTRQCAPTPSRLLVIPPDERTQTGAAWPGGPVCERGRIFVTALSAGTG